MESLDWGDGQWGQNPGEDSPLWWDAAQIYDTYELAFEELWGIPPELALAIGETGNTIFEAEFAALGAAAYNTSIIMPIRNAHYAARIMPSRHLGYFSGHKYETPILDYGCGVGFQLVWLAEHGYRAEDLWGYDLPGPQQQIAKHILSDYGINYGIPPNPKTIFCFHVLEHLENPFAKIDELLATGAKLYASCVGHKGHGHLVDQEKAKDVIAYLRKHNAYTEDYRRKH